MAKIPKKISKELVSRFSKKNETFLREKVKDKKRKIEIEVGDSKQDTFYPQFKTKHWDNETNFSLRLLDDDYAAASVETKKEKIEWKRGDRIARFYEKDDAGEDGGFEFEVELQTKPKTNRLEFSIQTKGLNFFKQKALNEEKIPDGHVATETELIRVDEDGNQEVVGSRPEDVVNSYAVYHATKKDNFADKDYRTGKAFHIHRVWAEDATGKRVWCDMQINAHRSDGTLAIIIPQEFLDEAVYPVLVDPTFGYTSIGASNAQLDNSSDAPYAWLNRITVPTTTSITSISAAVFVNAGRTGTFKALIYEDNAGTPNALTDFQDGDASFTNATYEWKTATFDVAPSLTAADYWIGAGGYVTNVTSSSQWVQLAYDTTGGDHSRWGSYFNAYPYFDIAGAGDPWVEEFNGTANLSVYATYPAVATDGDIAIYQDTSAQAMNSTSFADITMANEVIAEGGFNEVDDITKNLPNARVLALYSVTTESASGSNRTVTDVAINYNGSNITTGRSSGYLRRSKQDRTVQTGMAILPAGASNTIKLQYARNDNNAATVRTRANESALQLLQIGNVGAVYNAIATVTKATAGIVTGAPVTVATLIAGTWANVDWDTEAEAGTGFATIGGAGGDEVQVPSGKKILLSYGVHGQNSGNNYRRNIVTRVQVRDGSGGSWVDVDHSFATGYLRGGATVQNTNEAWSNWFGIIDTSAYTDPRVRVQFVEESEAGSQLVSYISAYIQMLELPTSAEYINLSQAGADITSINNTPADVSFESVATEMDTDSFGHSTAVNIEMKKAEKYLFLSQFFSSRNGLDTSRKEPAVIFNANGADIPYATGSQYNRGDQASTSTFLAGRAAGTLYSNATVDHVMKVRQVSRDSNTGTDNLLIEQERIALQGLNIPSLFAAPPAANPLIETLVDDFNDNSLDSQWFAYTNGGAGSVLEQNQRLEILSPASGTQSTGMHATGDYLFEDTQVTVEVESFNFSTGQYFWFGVYNAIPESVVFGITHTGNLIGRKSVGGSTNVFSVTYNKALHRFLRIRESSGTTYWETSGDGVTWTEQHSEATPIVGTTVWVETFVYGNGTQSAAATAIIDNVNVAVVEDSITKSLGYAVATTDSVTKSLSYMIVANSTIQKSLGYAIEVTAAITKGLTYRIETTPTAISKALEYAIFTTTAIQKSLRYAVESVISVTKSLGFEINSTQAVTKPLSFEITSSSSVQKTLAYRISATVAAITKSLGYEVTATASVQKSLSYEITASLTVQKSLSYGIAGKTSITKSLTYAVEAVKSLTKSLSFRIEVTPAQTTKSLTYAILASDSVQKSLEYQIESTSAVTKTLSFEIRSTGAITKALEFAIETVSAITKSLRYIVVGGNQILLSMRYVIETTGSIQKALTYQIETTGSITKSLGYVIERTTSITKSLGYAIETSGSITKDLEYVIASNKALTKTMRYAILVEANQITKSLAFEIKSEAAIQKTLTYAVETTGALTKTLGFEIETTSAATKSMQYVIFTQTTITKSLEFEIETQIAVTKQMTYAIERSSAITKSMRYSFAAIPVLTQKSMTYVIFNGDYVPSDLYDASDEGYTPDSDICLAASRRHICG